MAYTYQVNVKPRNLFLRFIRYRPRILYFIARDHKSLGRLTSMLERKALATVLDTVSLFDDFFVHDNMMFHVLRTYRFPVQTEKVASSRSRSSIDRGDIEETLTLAKLSCRYAFLRSSALLRIVARGMYPTPLPTLTDNSSRSLFVSSRCFI